MFVTILLILAALLVLSVLVVVHEWGHMMAAKSIGVWVEEFGIGLPPKVWSKKFGDTEYSINALPLGGFVRLHGETPDTKVTKPDMAFRNKSKFARAYVALAGIFMNMVLAVICLSLVLWLFGIERVKVVEVTPDSPASVAGVQVGDVISKVNSKDVVLSSDFPAIVQDFKGREATFEINRNGEMIYLPVQVNPEYKEGMGFTGVMFQSNGLTHVPLWERPVTYTKIGVNETVYWTRKTFEGFGTLFGQLSQGQKPQGVAGPLGITLTIAEILRYGAYNALRFSAIISINLAVINLVPFPPLDGSRVALLFVEAIFGKKNTSKIEHRILEVGMIILLGLILLLTITEIPKLIRAGSVTGFVDTLFEAGQ